MTYYRSNILRAVHKSSEKNVNLFRYSKAAIWGVKQSQWLKAVEMNITFF